MKKQLALMLHFADKLLKKNISEELSKLKLTSVDLAVIMDLHFQKTIGSEESRTEDIMADRLLIDRKTFKVVISELVERDWIVKIPNQIDRRSEELFLSAKAASIVDYLSQSYTYSEDRAFKGFTEKEKSNIIDYLSRISDNLQ